MSDDRSHTPPDATGNGSVVDSLLHPLANTIRQLLTRTGQAELHRIIVDDAENIERALACGISMERIFYAGDERLPDELKRRLPADVTVHEVARRTCKKLFENEKISRLFAVAHAPAPAPLAALDANARDIVVLEDLTIAGNIGAIIRTSVALYAGGIVLLNAAPGDVYDRRLIRASRGHVFSGPVVAATTDEFLRHCKQRRLPILVTTPHGVSPIAELATRGRRLAIVFGSEKEGCSEAIEKAADVRVTIPTRPDVESLNVSAAAAIVLYTRLPLNRS